MTTKRTFLPAEPSFYAGRHMGMTQLLTQVRQGSPVSALIAAAVLAVLLGQALAHGPCGPSGSSCLAPTKGPPGTEVSTMALEGVRVVWNPSPKTLLLGVPGSSKQCDNECAAAKPIYHHDLPMFVLAEEDEPARLQFEVPDVPPGKYLVVVYDGTENGQHYTWNVFEVTSRNGRSDPADQSVWVRWSWLPLFPLAAGLAGWLLFWTRRRGN